MSETILTLRLQTRTLDFQGAIIGTASRKAGTDALHALIKTLEDLGFQVERRERRTR